MTSFNTIIDAKECTYELRFVTDNKEYFEHIQSEARKCVDHKSVPIDADELLCKDFDLHPCRYAGGKLLHDGSWHPGKWYLWVDIYGNSEIARMKADAFDHFWPDTEIIKKEEDVVAFKDISKGEEK